jgi:hypothetical protein
MRKTTTIPPSIQAAEIQRGVVVEEDEELDVGVGVGVGVAAEDGKGSNSPIAH